MMVWLARPRIAWTQNPFFTLERTTSNNLIPFRSGFTDGTGIRRALTLLFLAAVRRIQHINVVKQAVHFCLWYFATL